MGQWTSGVGRDWRTRNGRLLAGQGRRRRSAFLNSRAIRRAGFQDSARGKKDKYKNKKKNTSERGTILWRRRARASFRSILISCQSEFGERGSKALGGRGGIGARATTMSISMYLSRQAGRRPRGLLHLSPRRTSAEGVPRYSMKAEKETTYC